MFISHASADTWVARQIAAQIQARGAATFLDVEQIPIGDDFRERILDVEPDCDELLVLLTPWSARRPWVLFEISCFIHARKRVVCILHGLTTEDAKGDPIIGELLPRETFVDINALDAYFEQVSRQIAAGQETR